MHRDPDHDHAAATVRRRRSAMGAAAALIAALTVLVGAPPASATVTSTYSGHTLTVTVAGFANFGVICQGGSVAITGIAVTPAPCNDVQHIVVNGDGATQVVGFELVTAATFPALINTQAVLGAGQDVLYASPRPDIVNMGSDRDAVHQGLNGAGDLINLGGDANDAALFEGTDAVNHLTLAIAGANPTVTSDGGASASVIGAGALDVNAMGGSDTIDATGVSAATTLFVSLTGGTGNDTIHDGPEASQIFAGSGDDVLTGGDGSDYLVGAAGNDQVDGGPGGDFFEDEIPLTDRVLGGDTYTDPDFAGTQWAARFSNNDAALRIRPVGGGWSLTSGLTRPGNQVVPANFTYFTVGTNHTSGGHAHRSVVDTVFVSDAIQTVASEPGDLVDVTVSSGPWQVGVNGSGGSYLTSTGHNGAVDGGPSTHFLAHVPWSDAAVSFAHRSYRDLLFRYPSAVNRENLAARIRSGATTRASVASTITGSDEYRGIEVDRVFAQFLRRPVDPSGRSYWVSQLSSPISMRAFRSNLLGSTEYYRNFGLNDPSTFVTALYTDVLNRTPDPSGLSYWVGRLNAGVGRGSVANSLLSSSEARTEIVTTQFLRLANRVPTSAEISLWSDRLLNQTTGETDLVASLLASTAYFSRIN